LDCVVASVRPVKWIISNNFLDIQPWIKICKKKETKKYIKEIKKLNNRYKKPENNKKITNKISNEPEFFVTINSKEKNNNLKKFFRKFTKKN